MATQKHWLLLLLCVGERKKKKINGCFNIYLMATTIKNFPLAQKIVMFFSCAFIVLFNDRRSYQKMGCLENVIQPSITLRVVTSPRS